MMDRGTRFSQTAVGPMATPGPRADRGGQGVAVTEPDSIPHGRARLGLRRGAIFAVIVTLATTGGISFAAIPNSVTHVITGCYAAGTGALRVIDGQAGALCKR